MTWRKLIRRPKPYRIDAYSEFMPPPRFGLKACGLRDISVFGADDEWVISEEEEREELRPGLQRIGSQLVNVLSKLGRGEKARGIDGQKLRGNPAWPEILQERGAPEHERYVVLMPLALSRTQDDKGRVRWTLFGASEYGPRRAFRGVGKEFYERLIVEVFRKPIKNYLVTFTPFARLPKKTQDAYLRGDLHLIPFPGSLLFFHSPNYRKLQRELPRAMQIPLLYSIHRSESPRGIRVPQSGWMREHEDTRTHHGPVRNMIKRTNRWTRVHRHHNELRVLSLTQEVAHTLFSTVPEDLGLYGKPLARNAQIWTDDYHLLLDGPNATTQDVDYATGVVDDGGHFGYRFFYPPMRVGETEVYLHRPLVAWDSGSMDAPMGFVEAGDVELRPIVRRIDRLKPVLTPSPELTFRKTANQRFESRYWKAIEKLVGANNADYDKTLDKLATSLLQYYKRLGIAAKSDRFRWITDFDYPWLERPQRNVIARIPGRDRRAVIMADHYDTAYMENVFGHSGHGPRVAAPGADDNHSATAALMLAAPIFLELSRQKKLAHDIWLVHLTGEEFPADCLGARHLCERIVKEKLDIEGVFVLDMVAHNNRKEPNVFQICPGAGKESMNLAGVAVGANRAWNQLDRLALRGEVRDIHHYQSTLYNTDGQIFSDTGIPVVLFMENYDINRKGYHDSHDTMENIDIDYGAAVVAIAIETVARVAVGSHL